MGLWAVAVPRRESEQCQKCVKGEQGAPQPAVYSGARPGPPWLLPELTLGPNWSCVIYCGEAEVSDVTQNNFVFLGFKTARDTNSQGFQTLTEACWKVVKAPGCSVNIKAGFLADFSLF